MPDATTYSAKKAKTTSTGPLLYSELDISNLTVDATLMGSNETRFATHDRALPRPTPPRANMAPPSL